MSPELLWNCDAMAVVAGVGRQIWLVCSCAPCPKCSGGEGRSAVAAPPVAGTCSCARCELQADQGCKLERLAAWMFPHMAPAHGTPCGAGRCQKEAVSKT